MPPTLGGFFMVRSYYPSECHADYFDFERIEALKPASEGCGSSTLSQSPTLGRHKQVDDRIKPHAATRPSRRAGGGPEARGVHGGAQRAASGSAVGSAQRTASPPGSALCAREGSRLRTVTSSPRACSAATRFGPSSPVAPVSVIRMTRTVRSRDRRGSLEADLELRGRVP